MKQVQTKDLPRLCRKFNIYGRTFERWLSRMLPIYMGPEASALPRVGTIAFHQATRYDRILRITMRQLKRKWDRMHAKEITESNRGPSLSQA